jgi:hypothetical protein
VCLSFVDAREEFPFDATNSVFKVTGKMFALSPLDGLHCGSASSATLPWPCSCAAATRRSPPAIT